MAVLALFSVVALWRAISGNGALETSVTPELSWLVPTGMSWGELAAGMILAIFIYWGWDTAVAVNEETSDPSKTPGKAAVLSTLALLATYVLVATAALAFGGIEGVTAEDHLDDILGYLGELVLGTWGGKLLILAVLTSAVASAQTTILPTARTTLSMAAYRAMPRSFARMHPTNLTPTVSTITMGVVSIAFYAGLTFISENVLADSIAATGLAIAFYYGITGFAAAWYFRNRAQGVGQIMAKIVLPFLGGVILFAAMIKVAYDSFDEDYGYTTFFGIGGVFVIGALSLALGLVLMILWNLKDADYFRSQPDDIEPRVLVEQVQEYRLVVEGPGIPYNPEALLAEAREEPAVPAGAEEEAVFLQDLGDESLNPPPTEPVDPDQSPRA
jgi:amino acid transporter